MFETTPLAPADPILGLSEAFAADARTDKINLSVGVYKNADGQTPILQAVKQAEARLLESEATKAYLPIGGRPSYEAAVQRLLFGEGSPVIEARRAATVTTPGGTGALRVIADYLKTHHSGATLWLSAPTWANHPAVFEAAGVSTRTYAYYDAEAYGLDAGLHQALEAIPRGDVVLFHGCCHNPTGVDPTPTIWGEIASLLGRTGAVPLIDLAYQGFGDGLTEDVAGLASLVTACPEVIVCSSFSKNLGLYRDRVGALTVVAQDDRGARAVHSQIKRCIRRNYSNPPAHGALVAEMVLSDAELRQTWISELNEMRSRIHAMRSAFSDGLEARGVSLGPGGNSFIKAQRGMFSFSGLTGDEVARLKAEHGVYLVGSGRINVAGITEKNVDRLCDAIAKVR